MYFSYKYFLLDRSFYYNKLYIVGRKVLLRLLKISWFMFKDFDYGIVGCW